MIRINGFSLLTTRLLNEKIDIQSWENKYNLKLPPLYRLFVRTFHLGDFKNEKYYYSELNEFYYCAGPNYYPKGSGKENIGITGFLEIDEVFDNWETKFGYDDETIELGLLRIATLGIDGSLFVGISDTNLDMVILDLWEKKPQFEKLADNIFEFVQGLILTPEQGKLVGNIKLNELYKNWGEDFWRVRGKRSNDRPNNS